MNPVKPEISVVIPARDEALNLPGTLEALEEELAGAPFSHETIVVDDHSTDGTAAVVEEVARSRPAVRVVGNDREPGFASALARGFRAARGEAVVVMMADACDDPRTVRQMREKFREGCDLVCGSRYLPGGGKSGGPRLQGFFSRHINRFLEIVVRVPTADASNAFKLYRRSHLLEVSPRERGFAVSLELTIEFWRRRLRICDVPTAWRGRVAGESKFRVRRAVAAYGRQVCRAIRHAAARPWKRFPG